MKRLGLMMVMMTLVLGWLAIAIGPARAGEKEELQAKLVALLQEERAITAEWQLYQAKLKELQDRAPGLQKEKQELSGKLKAMEEKEKASQSIKPPVKPQDKPQGGEKGK